MVLAAMAMMQTPVVPAEQAAMPEEVPAEAIADEIAPLAAETLLNPEEKRLAPETETLEAPLAEGGNEAARQAEELPQTIEAPEAPQNTE